MQPYCEKHQTYFERTGNHWVRYACMKCREERGSHQRGVDQLKWEGKR